jgi:hypothetical protein
MDLKLGENAMNTLRKSLVGLLACALCVMARSVDAAYTAQRVVAGLNQPTYMTQAPNDSSSLYIVERSDSGGQLGKIRRYDLITQTFSTFLDPTGTFSGDGGVLSMAFHPDYASNGLFFVVSNSNTTNGLDEFKVINGTPVLQRRLLQYQNFTTAHSINQVLFRPNGNNSELFVTTGDGGTQANEASFSPSLIESPNTPYGKLLKIDLTADFSTPAIGPTHSGVEVVALGLRNPFRSSFDRHTGDFYSGDVGFNTAEELNFIPSSHFSNANSPVFDFGWTSREGTVATVGGSAGGPGSPGDINPIFDYAHSGQPLPHTSVILGRSITAGYVYRGPIPELQGRYFFADFVNGNVYSGSFNTSTNPAAYNGTNLANILVHTAVYETQIGGANIQFVSSFAEDNAGNLYIVKFGNTGNPSLGQGEIFRIVPEQKPPGDFNGDYVVDGDDFLAWQQVYGSSIPAADANGNGLVDAADYTIWRDNLGAGNSSVEQSFRAVPEPSALILFLAVATAFCSKGRLARRVQGLKSRSSEGLPSRDLDVSSLWQLWRARFNEFMFPVPRTWKKLRCSRNACR